MADIWNLVMSVFGTADMISLIIMLAVVVIAGLITPGFGSVINMTMLALLIYAGSFVVRDVVQQQAEPLVALESGWNTLLGQDVGTLLVFFVAFLVVITVVYLLKSVVARD